MPIHVLLDTSSLGDKGLYSGPVSALFALGTAGVISILLPDIVFHERRTQWRDEIAEFSSQVEAKFTSLANQPLMPPTEAAGLAAQLKALKLPDSEALSSQVFDTLVKTHKIERLQITKAHADEAFSRYFAGKLPFASIKNRKDLPDGFILAAAIEAAAAKKILHCVCKDGTLSSALSKIPGIFMHKSVEEFLKCKEVTNAKAQWELEQKWQVAKHKLPPEAIERQVLEYITSNIDTLFKGRSVYSHEIPDDNNEGTIFMYDAPEEITVEPFVEWAAGWITVPVMFDTIVALHFLVFRSDAYSLPSWIHVTYGDPEEDHYFEAEGEKRIRVTLSLSANVTIKEEYDEEDDVLKDITIDELRIQLLPEDRGDGDHDDDAENGKSDGNN